MLGLLGSVYRLSVVLISIVSTSSSIEAHKGATANDGNFGHCLLCVTIAFLSFGFKFALPLANTYTSISWQPSSRVGLVCQPMQRAGFSSSIAEHWSGNLSLPVMPFFLRSALVAVVLQCVRNLWDRKKSIAKSALAIARTSPTVWQHKKSLDICH